MAAGSTSPVSPVSATVRVAPAGREPQGLQAGDLLRLKPGSASASGWTLESLDGAQVLSLIQPPLEDLVPGDELLMRVVSVWPRLALEVVERRGAGAGAGPQSSNTTHAASPDTDFPEPLDDTRPRWQRGGAGSSPSADPWQAGGGSRLNRADSGWSQLSALRADLAGWRRQMLADPGMPTRSLSTAQLIQGWAEALAQGRPPIGPGGEPFWLLPQPYWLRHERDADRPHRHPEPGDDEEHEPALSLLFKWKDAAVGLQLQGARHALHLTLLAESEQVLTALRSELPALVAALVRAGVRLQRLGWRQQALWVPVDPFPDLRADPGLLSAAAELMLALR
ncbi:hypothetical protein OU995_23180 [Roseateles sp. SL47]|uniref:hypothetical protein n=1 Tax=Roseateles sp. SL47 TaxID=2995138 RepID=UPI00226D76F3|nr:hypothetical protein [Roseateles sp. SL47]WAC72426.1 hypothetical protein OU995_23180 [Roseateles sp. SL47]